MSTTRSEQDQATQPVQSDEYQPIGRQSAPTSSEALYGGNADDNSGSGGNAHPTAETQQATDPDGNAQTNEEKDGAIAGPGTSGGTGESGTSAGQVNL